MSEESSTVEAPPAEQLVEGAVDGGESTEDGTGKTGPSRSELLIQEGDIAADYLERLLLTSWTTTVTSTWTWKATARWWRWLVAACSH
nr:hypothetical protein [Fodinicola feengrottensis]